MHSLAHFSNLNRPTMLKMGLQPITDSEWVEPFSVATLEQFNKHKQRELQSGGGAVRAHTRATAAVQELQLILFGYLASNSLAYPSACEQRELLDDASESAESILRNISFWLPDDICILQPQSELDCSDAQEGGHDGQGGGEGDSDGGDGSNSDGSNSDDYVLTAASVLSPSHWNPREKFLKPLAAIHEPIPGFDSELTPKITRFFNHLKVGKAVVRYNWGIQSGSALNWQAENEPAVIEESTSYYRSERQTLFRLPETGAVVFFIRIDLCPLSELTERYQDPLALDKLKTFVRDMPPQQIAYKGIDRFPWLLA